MTERRYDLDAMQAFVDLLDKQIAAVTEHSADVERTAEGVLSQFTGATADSFADSHTDWQATAAALLDELRAVRDQVAVVRTNYAAAETANLEMRA